MAIEVRKTTVIVEDNNVSEPRTKGKGKEKEKEKESE